MATLSLLLVDDEKPLLALLRRFLERAGYLVDAAETAQDALMKCRQQPCPFHVVVLDLKLPDMPGEALLPLLLDTAPGLRVLISSGTPFSHESLPPQYRARVGAILKPYMPAELVQMIQVLAPAASGMSV
jgi:two-component system response regulator ResD